MDVKQYYRKIREIEAQITDAHVLVVSIETSDGGKAGLVSEVTRANAAKIIAEGRASLATPEQQLEFRNSQEAARREAERLELSKRVQVAIISDADLKSSTNKKSSSER